MVIIWEVGHARLPYVLGQQRFFSQAYTSCYFDAFYPPRYRDLGFLPYTIAGIKKNMAYARRIFIVSPMGLAPNNVDVDGDPRLRLVDTAFVEGSKSPVFNVNALLFNLDLIPTLGRTFIAMTHDQIPVKPIAWTFFRKKGAFRYYLDVWTPGMMQACWGSQVKTAVRLFTTCFPDMQDQVEKLHMPAHYPVVVTQSMNKFLRNRNKGLLESLASHPFYHPGDPSYWSLYIWSASRVQRGFAELIPSDCHGDFPLFRERKQTEIEMEIMSPPCCTIATLHDGFWENFEEPVVDLAKTVLEGAIPGVSNKPDVIVLKSLYSASSIRVSAKALVLPQVLLNSYVSAEERNELRVNQQKRPWELLMKKIRGMDIVDIDNSLGPSGPSPVKDNSLRVTEFNAERGRYVIELASLWKNQAEFAKVMLSDFILLNEMDVGMVRSQNRHTTRLLAYALGLNYAYAVEFVELTLGTLEEQKVNAKMGNNWMGFHGNAILSKWPLRRASLVRITHGMDKYFFDSPHDKGEIRLGGRVAVFAESPVAFGSVDHVVNVTVVSWHATTKWADDDVHVKDVMTAIRKRIDWYGNKIVIFGGDTWSFTCEQLGLTPMYSERVGVNIVLKDGRPALGEKWMDAYICAAAPSIVKKWTAEVIPIAFKTNHGKVAPLGNHPVVTCNIELELSQPSLNWKAAPD